jgi:P-type Ca2+ transporter type 2C
MPSLINFLHYCKFLQILLLAAGVSFALAFFEDSEGPSEGLRAFVEPAVILLILALNATVGVWQESNAESALEALKEMSAETAKVLRDGESISDLPARELVPGDVIEIAAGDRIPADARVMNLRTAILRAEQSALTGESVAVMKSATSLVAKGAELQAKECMLFAGTGVASGSALALVNSTGMNTEIGKIQEQIEAAADEEDDTPLKKKLDEFGDALAKVILWVCVLVWVININHFVSWRPLPGWSWIPDPSTIQFSLAKATFYFKVAVALAVAAIPEGLPAVITTCLALGTRKMAKRNAIVRQLPSVETLGCTTVICSDKTGTLTTNQMSATTLVAFGANTAAVRDLEVDGVTFDPDEGCVLGAGTPDAVLQAVAEVCALCNDARLEIRNGSYRIVGQATEASLLVLAEKIGVPEAADQQKIRAQRSAEPMGACKAYASRYRRLATLEFDRDRKSMSVLCAPLDGGIAAAISSYESTASGASSGAAVGQQSSDAPTTRRITRSRFSLGQGKTSAAAAAATGVGEAQVQVAAGGPAGSSGSNVLLVKGAAECVLQRSSHVLLSNGSVVPLDITARTRLERMLDSKAGHALRLLAFAVKPACKLGALADYDGSETHPAHAELANPSLYTEIENGLVFVGLAGLRDPPRPEVASAIAACHAAGIRVLVITGDNKLTAEAVCRDIGVFSAGDDVESRSLTGSAFAALALEDRRELLAQGGGLCFSRAEPRHKQDIVRLLKEMGEVTAMTGDGVNDAPALKLADIGVAMGIAGTEVAKQASDMVLADDNFATVVAAVEEGRAIYNNMKAFIRYMISSNIGEVASIFLSAAAGLPEGLIPVQLLWVNLVTDGPPATALGFNRPDPDIMSKRPRRADDHFLTPWILFRWLTVGMYVGVATVGVFAAWYTSSSFLGIDLSGDGHTPVTLEQLRHWESCSAGGPMWIGFAPKPFTAGGKTVSFNNPCEYFAAGKIKASTLSLSVLVAIEMFNAANALSEDNSLLKVPVWSNPWLLLAMALSFGLHFLILYVPPLAEIFSIVPLSFNEWLLVLAFALPVVFIDEVLKFIGRNFVHRPEVPVKAKLE